MKRFVLLAVLCISAVGCGDDQTAAPSSLPLLFTAQLSPSNEVPPVTNADAGGHGSVQISFNVTRDASGAITAARAGFYFQISGFPGDTNVVGAHIHPGVAGVNGAVIVSTGLTAAAPLPAPGGIIEFHVDDVTVDPALMQSIINNPSGFYFNVHSTLNPGGFARGQLVRIQ